MDSIIFFTGNIYQIIRRICAGLCAVAVFLHWQNYGIRTTRYVYESDAIPQQFRGFKIRQISDYHNTALLHRKIVNMTMAEKPDIIVITGDLFDCRKTDVETGVSLVSQLVKIAPVYMVTGNHEARIDGIQDIKQRISDTGVRILDNETTTLSRSGATVMLTGVSDPRFFARDKETRRDKRAFRNNLLAMTAEDKGFRILLSHRPEFIHTYRDCGVNLALTGHAHGGQFSIPFTDIGVFVPNQGLFPPFAAGMKTLDNTTMIISRGIGNSVFPFRLFNRPEIVTVKFE